MRKIIWVNPLGSPRWLRSTTVPLASGTSLMFLMYLMCLPPHISTPDNPDVPDVPDVPTPHISIIYMWGGSVICVGGGRHIRYIRNIRHIRLVPLKALLPLR